MALASAAAGMLALTGTAVRTVVIETTRLSGDVVYVDRRPEALLGQDDFVTAVVVATFVILIGWSLSGLPRQVPRAELTARLAVWAVLLAVVIWWVVMVASAAHQPSNGPMRPGDTYGYPEIRLGAGGMAVIAGLFAGVDLQVVGLVRLRRVAALSIGSSQGAEAGEVGTLWPHLASQIIPTVDRTCSDARMEITVSVRVQVDGRPVDTQATVTTQYATDLR